MIGAKAVPPEYRWIVNEDAPAVFREALKLYGTKEIQGAKHNPVILGWALEIREFIGIDYTADETPWCGLFIGVCAHRAGYKPPFVCIRAKEWAKFGTVIHENLAKFGDILVFDRDRGGHVGLYIGEDKTHFHVLGGNQDNQVCIRRLHKGRLLAVRRWPWRIAQPWNVRKIYLDATGKISENEK